MSKILTIDTSPTAALPSPAALRLELPASSQHLEFVRHSISQVCRILSGEDPRMLLIVGPCSIHDSTAAKEYAIKLRELADRTSKSFFILMRSYFEKPRTSHGWKGMFYDPYLDGSHDINAGLRQCRALLLELAEFKIPVATEFLDLTSPSFFGDLVSWACIGARTAESQPHRQLASGLPMPIAFKNSTSGNIDIAVNGSLIASSPHTYLGIRDDGHMAPVSTNGNKFSHIVLRGGKDRPNFDSKSINEALEKLELTNQPRRLIVDCSHGNSSRDYEQQIDVFRSIIHQRLNGNMAIKGAAIESHLFAGNQHHGSDISHLKYGMSLTDPCLDWPTTERLVQWGADMLQKQEIATPYIKAKQHPDFCARI